MRRSWMHCWALVWLVAISSWSTTAATATATTTTGSGDAHADPVKLYDKAYSLLQLVTTHAPVLSPEHSPHLVPTTSYSHLFQHVERKLPGTVLKFVFRSVRKTVELVSRSKEVKEIVKDKVASTGPASLISSSSKRRRSSSSSTSGQRSWRDDILSFDGVTLTKSELADALQEVVSLAHEAAQAGSDKAWLMLGDLHLRGYLTLEPNVTFSRIAYEHAATEHGNAQAQYMLGFLHSSNYQNAVAIDTDQGQGHQGSALLYYTFSALGGHVPAMMSVGYRHWNGIGTKQSCKDALAWYKNAADEAMRTFNSGPPGGLNLPPLKARLSDQSGGPYGPGSSTRVFVATQSYSDWTDLVEFHLFHAQRGELAVIYRLARLYYNGYTGISPASLRDPPYGERRDEGVRDYRNAHKWLMRLARNVWPRDAKEAFVHPKAETRAARKRPYYNAEKDARSTNVDEHAVMIGGLAAGILGKMYLRGEGVKVDYQKAYLWFMRGSSAGDRESHNGLGIMFRDALGVDRDVKRANLLFIAAAQQDHAEAQVNLGKYYFGIGDFNTAKTYFEHAIRMDGIRQPETFQSYYYLAELYSHTSTAADHCPRIVSFYKATAERGDWKHSLWWDAERAYARGDVNKALLDYWIMAERGYEAAQNNVAWLLDRDKKWLKIPHVDLASSNASDRLALTYWTRSAAQDNVDSLLKMGDYYYAGLGLPEGLGDTAEAEKKASLEKAAAAYQSAAGSRISAMALWNLGWMHENGQGVSKDYHLAKRYYDQALETSVDAFLPATLSLCALYLRSLYYSIVHPSNDLNTLSLFETAPLTRQRGQGLTLKKAWTDLKRQWGFEDPPDSDSPLTTAPHRGGEGDTGDGSSSPDDVLPPGHPAAGANERTAAARRALEGDGHQAIDDDLADPWGYNQAFRDEDEDEFAMTGDDDFGGTLAIVALCCALAFLLYVRQGQQLAAAQARAGERGDRRRQAAQVSAQPQPAHAVPRAPEQAQPTAAAQVPAPTPTPTAPAPIDTRQRQPAPEDGSSSAEREEGEGDNRPDWNVDSRPAESQ